LGGRERVAAESDPAPDVEALVAAVVAGRSFPVIQDGVEGVGARQSAVLGEGFIEEPMTVGGGTDGEDVESA